MKYNDDRKAGDDMLVFFGMLVLFYVLASLLDQKWPLDIFKVVAVSFITIMVSIVLLGPVYQATPIQHTEKVMLQPLHDSCYVISFGANVLINDGTTKRMIFLKEPIALQKSARPVLINESGKLNGLVIWAPPKRLSRIIVSKVEDIDFNGQDVNLTYIEKEK
jgi:hypothetical protein